MGKTTKKKSKFIDKMKSTELDNNDLLIKVMVYGFGGFMLGLAVGMVLMNTIINNTAGSSNNKENVVTTYEYDSEILTGDKATKAKNDILKYTELVYGKNTYTQVMTSDTDYMCYIYNTNKEVYVESSDSSYSEVYLNNGTSFGFSSVNEEITKGSNVDIINMIKNAANAIGKVNGVTLYDMDLKYLGSNAGVKSGDHEYRIDLKGEEAVKALYSSADDKFASDMVEALKEDLEGWEPHIIILCYISENIEKSYFSAIINEIPSDDSEYFVKICIF